MSLLSETKRILRSYGILPKKRFGQNFLIGYEVLDKMVSHAALGKEDVVLEIGAGLGFLTENLAKKARQVIAVEVDAKLINILRERLHNYENVTIVQGDILRIIVPSFNKVVSTPPYFISSPLLFWLLEKNFECAVLTFQEEFAKRLVASAGSGDYGRLTISAYYRAGVELLNPVPRRMFWPPPDVDSMIVRLKPRKPPFFVEDEKMFLEVVQVLFTQKNKKMRNAIIPFFNKYGISERKALELADTLRFSHRRPRELSPEELALTVNEIVNGMRELNLLPS